MRKEFHAIDTQWVGIPVTDHKNQKISKVKIDHDNVKMKRQLKKIEYLFHNTPYFDYYYPTIKEILKQYSQFEYLADFNVNTILEISKLLKINSNFSRSSEINLDQKGSNYNLALVEHFKSGIYYSGVGAKEYQSEEDYTDKGIKLIYLDTLAYLKENKYVQHQGEFLPGLSVIDTIMNIGVEGVREIFFAMRQNFNPNQII